MTLGDVTVALMPLDSTDMALVRSWRNDWRIWQWTRQNDLISDVEQARWFQRQSEDPTIRMWKLMAAAGTELKPAGVCGLTSICHVNKRAEFSCYIAPDMHGKGLGTAALRVLFDHGFDNLGLRLIWGETFDGNPAARLFERLGMVKEGTRRSFYWKDGRWVDAHLFSITAEEWRAARAARDLGGQRGDQRAAAVDPGAVAAPTPKRRTLGAAGRLGSPATAHGPSTADRPARQADGQDGRGAVGDRARGSQTPEVVK